ncbi:MAG: DUF1501 domain-containing protein [Planctomycetaceae bacterium]
MRKPSATRSPPFRDKTPQIGGPGFRDFHWVSHPNPSLPEDYYEPRDTFGGDSNRRTIYRMWVRSLEQPLLDVFDCPDPSAAAERRNITTTPLQSLALWNNPFMVRSAEKFAERVAREAGGDAEQQVVRAFRLALLRSPETDELLPARALIEEHGLEPTLDQYHAKEIPDEFEVRVSSGIAGLLHRSFFPFQQRGDCGKWTSNLFPEINRLVDELTFIHSLAAGSADHTAATYEAHSGFLTAGYPAAGAWLSYGLGCETDDLPAFVVLPDSRSLPQDRATNWSASFLPAQHQGVVFQSGGPPVRDLEPFRPVDDAALRARSRLLREMNERHLERLGPHAELSARIRSYELAARMHLAVPEVADLDGETASTQSLYGLGDPRCADFARSCLIARRLLERGVRFVQLWAGGRTLAREDWDAHEHLVSNHTHEAKRIDRPVAGLLRDLKQRGLLEDTLVVFNTEFGRTPVTEAPREGMLALGRGHNPTGFTAWMAGAGLKPGFSYGATDVFGAHAIERRMDAHDFHATILHLLGIDHKRLTFERGGAQLRLTNLGGEVHQEFLA